MPEVRISGIAVFTDDRRFKNWTPVSVTATAHANLALHPLLKTNMLFLKRLNLAPQTRLTILLIAFLMRAVSPAIADTTLTILTHYTDAQRAPLTACLAEYEREHQDVHIVHHQAEIEDYLQTILTGRLSGMSPDIYNIYSLWGAQLIQSGMLAKPPPDVSHLIATAYAPSTLQSIQVAGEVWGIPTEVSTFMLIYNKKLFRQFGITAPPRDWNEVVVDAAKITQRNKMGKITTAGFAVGPTTGGSVYPFGALLLSHGTTLFTPKMDGTNLSTDQAYNVLNDEISLFKRGITDNTIQVRDFPSGAVGMMIFANWYKAVLQQAFGAALNDTVGVAAIPAGPDWRTLQYAFFWAVDADSPNKVAAWNLLSWLNSPQTENKPSCTGVMLGKLGALTGNINDVATNTDDFGDAFTRPFADAITSGRAGSLPNALRSSDILDNLRLMVGKALSQAETPQAALQAADQEITALLHDNQ